MKTTKQIADEAAKLRKMKPTVIPKSMFGDDHHAAIDAQVWALEQGASVEEINDKYNYNTREGENTAAYEAHEWMCDDGDKPSDGWKELVRKK
jgi:hypothetical protein